jgi:uncharacterized membrane protein YtjA (UPF0391 family)
VVSLRCIAVLRRALLFLVLGLIAGLSGLTGIAGLSLAVANFLFFVFLAVSLAFFVVGAAILERFSRY